MYSGPAHSRNVHLPMQSIIFKKACQSLNLKIFLDSSINRIYSVGLQFLRDCVIIGIHILYSLTNYSSDVSPHDILQQRESACVLVCIPGTFLYLHINIFYTMDDSVQRLALSISVIAWHGQCRI